MTHHLPPSLQRFGTVYEAAVRAELAPTLAHADRPLPGRSGGAGFLRRPRVLAGGTLGLAGVAAALAIALGAGGATAPPAFAITKHSDGSVLVQLNRRGDLGQANQKLTEMGTHEQITLYLIPGPAVVSGPVSCTPAPGTGPPNPPVQVLVGTDGSTSGQSAGNTGEGTSQLACIVGPTATRAPTRAIPATPTPVDRVTAAGARSTRASALTRLAVRSPPGDYRRPDRPGGHGCLCAPGTAARTSLSRDSHANCTAGLLPLW
jgi:hypothetical protein